MSFSTLFDATECALQQNSTAYETLVLAALQIVLWIKGIISSERQQHTLTHTKKME